MLQLLTGEPSGQIESGTADLSYRLIEGLIAYPLTSVTQSSGRIGAEQEDRTVHAESTSYGISRPELDLATCYLHAPLASQDLTHGYAGPTSLEPSDIYINDEDGLLRQPSLQPVCSVAEL